MNNEMDDSAPKLEFPNMFGLNWRRSQCYCSGEANAILYDTDNRRKGTANSGWWRYTWWSTIITSVVQTILNVYEFGMGMQLQLKAASLPNISGFLIW